MPPAQGCFDRRQKLHFQISLVRGNKKGKEFILALFHPQNNG
jgi:hypothetical protein